VGYVRGFVHGTVAGTVIGLCVAPQTGDKTRAQLKVAGAAAREGITATSRTLRRMAPVAGSAIHAVEQLRHRSGAAPQGNGRVSAPAG
jgi:gas vesicle protein